MVEARGAFPVPVQQETNVQHISRRALAIGAGVVAAVVVVGGLSARELMSNNSDNSIGNGAVNTLQLNFSDEAKAACKDLAFNPQASDATKFDAMGLLPKNGVNSNDGAQKFTESLFKTGPLGGKNADKVSLAFASVAIGRAATDHKPFDPQASLVTNIDAAINSYGAANGMEAARRDCAVTYDVLKTVTSFNPAWVNKGDAITKFSRFGTTVGGVKISQVANGALQTMKGTEYTLNQTGQTENYDGFGDLFVSSNGILYGKGNVKEGQSKDHSKEGSTPTPSNIPTPENQNTDNGNNGPITSNGITGNVQKNANGGQSTANTGQSTANSSEGGANSKTGTKTGTAGTGTGTAPRPGTGTGTGSGIAPGTGSGGGGGGGTGGGETAGPGPAPAPSTTEAAPQPAPSTTEAPRPVPSTTTTEAPAPSTTTTTEAPAPSTTTTTEAPTPPPSTTTVPTPPPTTTTTVAPKPTPTGTCTNCI